MGRGLILHKGTRTIDSAAKAIIENKVKKVAVKRTDKEGGMFKILETCSGKLPTFLCPNIHEVTSFVNQIWIRNNNEDKHW